MTSVDRQVELRLVDGLRAGEPEAFDEVYAAFNARLYTFLARLTNRRDVAEDLLEETWLRLVMHARRLRPDTRLAPWLFTVARNLHVSFCRTKLLEEAHAGGLIGLWPSGAPIASPFDEVDTREIQQRVAAALATLPVDYREALLLVGVEGMRPADAADACGVTAEAMRQRLHRARALLARRLSEMEQGGRWSFSEVPA
jgi:RNA polymerase sigma-70 factor (ECF subfamily)